MKVVKPKKFGRTIWIDDELYRWIARRAKPLKDNPNSVIKRGLGLGKKVTTDNQRGESR